MRTTTEGTHLEAVEYTGPIVPVSVSAAVAPAVAAPAVGRIGSGSIAGTVVERPAIHRGPPGPVGLGLGLGHGQSLGRRDHQILDRLEGQRPAEAETVRLVHAHV